jgi:hypothetical protein
MHRAATSPARESPATRYSLDPRYLKQVQAAHGEPEAQPAAQPAAPMPWLADNVATGLTGAPVAPAQQMPQRSATSPAPQRIHSTTSSAGSQEPPLARRNPSVPGSREPPDDLLWDMMMQRQREPCYVACRLWGVNEIDFKRMRAVMVFRVHLIFRPRKEALQFLPPKGKRVNSEEEAWKELEKIEALPTLSVLNGKPVFTSKQEFFRMFDAKSVYDDTNEVEIWFPPLQPNDERQGTIAVLTGQMEVTDVQLDFNFEEFPFDAHELCVKLFLPKKHKDKMYELHCDPNMRVKSEGIKAKEEGGQGILEVKPDVKKSLFEWEIIPENTELVRNENATGEQSGVTMRIGIRRIPQFYVTKFLIRPGVIAALACVSTFILSDNIGDRLALTFTILLTLTGINYTSSDSLPALPYSTALDKYHEACHYLVYGVIAHNVIFFLYAFRCSKSCAAEPTTNTAAGTVDPTMAACIASADAPCAAAAEVADVAATVASRWCSMCGYNIVVDYWILLDLDDFVMSFIFAYWIYWNVKWFAAHNFKWFGTHK